MLCAEPLHVQRCSSSLFADEKTIAHGKNASCVEEERRVWHHCTVSKDLRVRFFRFRDGGECDGCASSAEASSTSTSSFFTVPCMNVSEVVRKDGEKAGVLTSLLPEMVVASALSCRTAYPHVLGSASVHATDLLGMYNSALPPVPMGERCVSEGFAAPAWSGKAAAQREESGFVSKHASWLARLSLAVCLPTIAVLVRFGAGGRCALLVLRPHVHAGQSASLAYRASLVGVSGLARVVSLSPCGRRVLALPEHFATVEDPLRACEASTAVLTGEMIGLCGAECSAAVPFHVLAGALACGSSGARRMGRVLGSGVAFVQCRESAAGGSGELEVVVVSQRGTALVCVAGGVAGAALCGVCFRCARCVVCATTSAGGTAAAAARLAGSRGGAALWQSAAPSHVLLDRETGSWSGSSSGSGGASSRRHVPRQRVLGCSADGLVLLCAPASDPSAVAAVLTSSLEGPRRLGVPSAPCAVQLPAGFELQDAHFVTHARVCGALLCGVVRDPAVAAADKKKNKPCLTARSCCPLQLYFLCAGAREAVAVSMMSFRQWAELPADFFAAPHTVRLLSVEVVRDPSGSDALLVALGSTCSAKVVATALVSLPCGDALLRDALLAAGAEASAGEAAAGAVCRAVETHVAQTVALLTRREEFVRRQHRVAAAGLLRAADLEQCFGVMSAEKSWDAAGAASRARAGPSVAAQGCMMELMLLAAAARDEAAEMRRGSLPAGGAGAGAGGGVLCGLEEECMEALRLEVLERQRGGADVNPCVSCVCGLFAGVQRGVDAGGATCGRGASAVVERHAGYFGALASVLVSGVELLALCGAASGIQAAAALLHQREDDAAGCAAGGAAAAAAPALLTWGALLRPVFDAAYVSTASAPVTAVRLLPSCSAVVREADTLGREWLQAEEARRCLTIAGATFPMLTLAAHQEGAKSVDAVVQCVDAGPSKWSELTVLDIYWAARRLFLSHGAAAAVKLLKPLSTSSTCAASVKQLLDMYSNVEDRICRTCIHCGGF